MQFGRKAIKLPAPGGDQALAKNNAGRALHEPPCHGAGSAPNTLTKLAILSLIITAPCLAEDSQIDLPNLGASEGPQWRQVSGLMTHQQYRSAVRHNQRMIRRLTEDYVAERLTSMGMSERTVSLTGATVGFLAEGGGKLSLNNSDTLALEVEDFGQGDRAMLLRYKVDW